MRFLGSVVASFNLEITNRCAIACPECARTNNPWLRRNQTEVSLDLLRRIFPLSAADTLRGIKINLCGAYGDCIYHSAFPEVVAHLKAVGFLLNVETNGSHRPQAWWERTCDILTDEDVITFSVDGLEDTNHIYRVNSRWQDVLTAMRTCAARRRVDWKFIVFWHNEHQLEEARRLARELGVRHLTFKKSARFREIDPLAPRDEQFIGTVSRNRQKLRRLLEPGVPAETLDREVKILPKCVFGKNAAITARGYFYPCTSCETGDSNSWFTLHQGESDLRRRSLEEIFASPHWAELEASWSRASTAPPICVRTCGVHVDFVERYKAESRANRPNMPEDIISFDQDEG
jgi:MoaA/NifB/PqqE/SkfB family radical SAM enzyme